MKITVIQKERAKVKLKELKEKLKVVQKEYEEAWENGDHSENADLDSAKLERSRLKEEIKNLESLLENEVITFSKSPIIVEGSFLKISSPKLKEPILAIFASKGDLITEGILQMDSELGRAINGKLPNKVYTVKGVDYFVEKLTNPNIELFIKEYPGEDILIKGLFEQ